MAVPKKRTGKSAQAKRRANWKATVPATTVCKQCGNVVLTHTVCPECGSYKGKVVSIKAQPTPAVEIKKPAKEETKAEEVKEVKETKAEVKEETKAEEKPKRTRKKKAEAESENEE